jgi:phosphatidylserine/phosphatidylglycerophosphate/cardiolipin synthase-like enzyme
MAALVLAAGLRAGAQELTPTSMSPGAAYEIGFSPGESAEELVTRFIDSARSSVLVAAYEFTSRPITAALESAAARGVKVYLIADAKEAAGRYSEVSALARAGLAVKVDSRYAIFHHKFMVVDGRDLETGSFNYTYSAEARNAENVLVLWNVPGIAAVYTKEWGMLWDQSQAVR